MKKKKLSFEQIEKEVKSNHIEREYRGAYDNFLHSDVQLRCLMDEEYKKLMIEIYGDLKYRDEVLKQANLLKARKAEVEFIKREFK